MSNIKNLDDQSYLEGYQKQSMSLLISVEWRWRFSVLFANHE